MLGIANKSSTTTLALLLLLNIHCPANNSVDSLQNIRIKHYLPHQRLDTLIGIAELKLSRSEHDCLFYAESALRLADSLNNPEKIAETNYISGLAWRLCGDNLMAINKFYIAASLFNDLNSNNRYAVTMREIGETYRANGNHENSLEFLRQAIAIQNKVSDTLELAKTYNRIAATKYEIILLRDAYLDIMQSDHPSPEAMSKFINGDDNVKKNLDSTFRFIALSDSFSFKYDQKEIFISNRIIEGALYSAILQFNKADSILNLALSLVDKEEFKHEKPLVFYNLSRLRMNQKRYSEAINYSVKGFEIAQKDSTRIYMLITSHLLGDLYQRVGNPSEAIKYINIAQSEIAFFYKSDLGIRIKTLQYQSDIEKKKAEILMQSTRTKYLVYSFTYILSVIVLIFIIIYLKNRKLKRLNQQLEQKSLLIAKQNEELVLLNAEKDRFFSIIAHDLRSPAGTFVSVSDIITHELKKKRIDKALLLSENLKVVANHLYSLLENLLDWSKLQRKTIHYNPVKTKLRRCIEDSALTIVDGANNKGIKIDFDIADDVEAMTDVRMLQTVIRNLLSNAVKFTPKGGSVKITVSESNGYLEISVEDTGIGMDSEMLDNLFNANGSTSRLGTDYEPSSGLGLTLCKDFVMIMGGTIRVESAVSVGSKFTIRLPLVV